MNYELAMMALQGLSRSPVRVEIEEKGVEISGDPAALRELARLLLLLGGDGEEAGERVDLAPGIHLRPGSPAVSFEVE